MLVYVLIMASIIFKYCMGSKRAGLAASTILALGTADCTGYERTPTQIVLGLEIFTLNELREETQTMLSAFEAGTCTATGSSGVLHVRCGDDREEIRTSSSLLDAPKSFASCGIQDGLKATIRNTRYECTKDVCRNLDTDKEVDMGNAGSSLAKVRNDICATIEDFNRKATQALRSTDVAQ